MPSNPVFLYSDQVIFVEGEPTKKTGGRYVNVFL